MTKMFDNLVKTVGVDVSMSDHYFQIYNFFREKYEKLVILYKNGKFYEIMERNNIGCTTEVSELLLLTTYNRGESFCCGIQADSLEVKYLQPLISEGYTIVIVDETERNNGLITRGISEIISAGTNINSGSSNDNYILVIYEEKESVGLVVISISTGNIFIQETYNKKDDRSLVENEVQRWINMYIPKEILLIYSKLKVFGNVVNLERKKEYDNVNFQRSFFNKIYNVEADVDILVELNIHRSPLILRALMYGFEYIYEHNEKLLYKMKYPKDAESGNNLILDYNTILQLNLLSDNNLDNYSLRYDSVFSVINKAKTAMGRRLIKERLTSPVMDISELNRRYDLIEKFKKVKGIDLRGILDIDKRTRKLIQGSLSIQDLVNLVKCIGKISGYIKKVPKDLKMGTNINEFLEDINSKIDLEKLAFKNILELDNIMEENKKIKVKFGKIMEKMNGYINENPSRKQVKVRLESTAMGYYIICTLKKGVILKKKYPDYTFRATNGGYKITSEEINKLSEKFVLNEIKYGKLFDYELYNYEKYLGDKYSNHLENVSYFVAQIDLYLTQAELSINNVYCRPEILEGERSCIIAKDLRHVLIERLLKDTLYVPNDVEIGTDSVQGLLLYGVNASGKTSYVKSIGVSIILAQAGFYVPAKEYKYVPFRRLQTRISGNDNLFRGESSFSVEINEIKNVLMRSDEKSLVLGDEICRGTTNADAEALVLSVINYLEQNNKTNFIFASHIHKIARDKSLKETTISKHMKVNFMEDPDNPKEKIIVYDRKLEDTEGEEFYGIEVAEAFNLPKKVIKLAEKRRKEIVKKNNKVISEKRSRYNKNVFMDKCELCGITENLETHHINPQKNADENGIIGHHSKNNEANLSVLCKECHGKITRNKVKVSERKRTSKGPKLIKN